MTSHLVDTLFGMADRKVIISNGEKLGITNPFMEVIEVVGGNSVLFMLVC